jgi:membrane-associated phospholipid phosphatase
VPTDELRTNNLRTVRRLCAAGYATVLVLIVAVDGVPSSRAVLMSLIVSGLVITTIGYGWRRLGRVLLDWLPFTLVLMVYDLSRGLANATNLPLHERDIASVEQWMFGGQLPTVWLQHHLYQPGTVHWYDALSTLVYFSHFIATPLLAALLWIRNRSIWIAYISRVIALSFAGLMTYVLVPEAPPWLAARDHVIEPVSRLSAQGWIWLRVDHVESLLDAAQRDGSNPVAAMPSLHTAFATLLVLFIGTRLTSRWRYLLALYPAAMGFVLVYTGEHYMLDVVVGMAYAVVVHALVSQWERWRGEVDELNALARYQAAAGRVAV